MTHDKFCAGSNPRIFAYACGCDAIKAVRQNEREQMMQEIESHDFTTVVVGFTILETYDLIQAIKVNLIRAMEENSKRLQLKLERL